MSTSIASPIAFDRKFVFAAILVGIAYVIIIVLVGSIIDKNAAGVAGVALTALATGIFKQFETLRFRVIAENEGSNLALPGFNWWYVLLIGFGFAGIQVLGGMFGGLALAKFGLVPTSIDGDSIFELLGDNRIWVGLVSLVIVSHAAGGYLTAKTAPSPRYSYALLGSMQSLLIGLLLPVLAMVQAGMGSLSTLLDPSVYIFGIFWIMYLGAALLGARVGFSRTKKPNNALQATIMAIADAPAQPPRQP